VETFVEGSRRADHFPVLDGARGLAIALVFLFHALGASFSADQLPEALRLQHC
jgi:peptidoglycan/LPS O-acetylase OafA/YrhL